jgi:hypothetical protein
MLIITAPQLRWMRLKASTSIELEYVISWHPVQLARKGSNSRCCTGEAAQQLLLSPHHSYLLILERLLHYSLVGFIG